MSEPILASLYKNNPNNCYIDFGSSLDRYIHQKDTRPYTNPNSKYGRRNCWLPLDNNKSFTIGILYEELKKQFFKTCIGVRNCFR